MFHGHKLATIQLWKGHGSDRILNLIKENAEIDYAFKLLHTLVVNNAAGEIKEIFELLYELQNYIQYIIYYIWYPMTIDLTRISNLKSVS